MAALERAAEATTREGRAETRKKQRERGSEKEKNERWKTKKKFFFNDKTNFLTLLSLPFYHGDAGTATAAAAAASASRCAALGVYCASRLVLRETSARRWPSGTSNLSTGTTDTERSCLVTLKTTMPSVSAKRVSSVPRPTSVPGWNWLLLFGWIGSAVAGGGGEKKERR